MSEAFCQISLHHQALNKTNNTEFTNDTKL